jgi:hypothetical protein
MALASSVSGTGKLISASNENGTYEYSVSSVDYDEDTETSTTRNYLVTVSYTDERTERKWYALTAGAVTDYITANPTEQIQGTCVNEQLDAWEMTVTTVDREITGVSMASAPSGS